MQLIDIGVNLTNKRLSVKVEQILQQAQQAGVIQQIVTGTSIAHSKQAVELCQRYPDQLYCTAGVHPHDAKEWTDVSVAELKALISHDCVRAVGETGLDFNRNFSPPEKQIEVFQQQLEIACEYNKPVFLHQRDAMDTFGDLLKAYRSRLQNVVVHCFTDDQQALYSLLDLDCHIGITGWICDERRGQELQRLVSHIPNNRLMLETDAPYLLPRDLKPMPADKTNLPEYLPHILHTVARHQQKDVEILAREVLSTTQKFFGITT
jgi:TatD DNase family protein